MEHTIDTWGTATLLVQLHGKRAAAEALKIAAGQLRSGLFAASADMTQVAWLCCEISDADSPPLEPATS